jgi:hypothetical protein
MRYKALLTVCTASLLLSGIAAHAQCDIKTAKSVVKGVTKVRQTVAIDHVGGLPGIQLVPVLSYTKDAQGDTVRALVVRFVYNLQGEKLNVKTDTTITTTFHFEDGTQIRVQPLPIKPSLLVDAAAAPLPKNSYLAVEPAYALTPALVEAINTLRLEKVTFLPKQNTTALAYYRKTLEGKLSSKQQDALVKAIGCLFSGSGE